MDDLIAFLAARLGEDEALAKRGEEVFATGWPDYQTFDSPELDDACKYLDRFGPARVLREVEAKRAVITQWEHSPAGSPVLTNALYRLAAAWSDHPGYRPEWKP